MNARRDSDPTTSATPVRQWARASRQHPPGLGQYLADARHLALLHDDVGLDGRDEPSRVDAEEAAGNDPDPAAYLEVATAVVRLPQGHGSVGKQL